MDGSEVISALMKKFRAKNDNQLSKQIGLTAAAIGNWNKRKSVTTKQIVGL